VAQVSETVEVSGHVIDTGVLSRVLDDVREYGGDFHIDDFTVGKDHDDPSYARITVTAADRAALERLLMRLQGHGVNLVNPGDIVLRDVELDGVFPDDFYSTTNLETVVRLAGQWIPVSNPEMDCGLLVEGPEDNPTVRTVPVSEVRRGQRLVCGATGVRVVPLDIVQRPSGGFEFMNSPVSTEKPQALLLRQIAQQMREVKAAGRRSSGWGGQRSCTRGRRPRWSRSSRRATSTCCSRATRSRRTTSKRRCTARRSGIDLSMGHGVEHGHEHHIRAINRIRKAGNIAAAVEQGVLTRGVMHALVMAGRQFVLVGSVRDDGPCPTCYTDVVEGQRAMRSALTDVGFAIMVATMLHSVATGNILPAAVPLVCVDINPAAVTKLSDRGSSQARGIVTDIGLFLEQLANELAPGWRGGE
jgi:lysine-ketoglutarate reductase/saccharopine dehydrogenase-like protein (TIGR00300 family)